MYLRGQQRESAGDRGIAMAALLVSLAVMSVLMAAALPAWRHQARREKEAELVFRGEQYVRAIALWERRMGPGSRPANFDILVQQRFLRKKYKDPMTEDGEFQPLFAGANTQPQGPGGRGGTAQTGRGAQPQGPTQLQPPPGGGSGPGGPGGGTVSGVGGGGIFGVVSKSKERSIRLYKGQSTYNTWQFIHAGAAQGPGGGVGGGPRPGGPGQQGPGFPGRGGPGGGRGPGGGAGPGRGPGGPAGPGGGGRGAQPGPGQGLPPGVGPGRGRGQ